MSEDQSHPPRFCFPVSRMLVVAAILSFQAAVFIPALNIARAKNGKPPILPWVNWLFESIPEPVGLDERISMIAAPFVAMVVSAASVVLICLRMPAKVRKYFPLRAYPKLGSKELSVDGRTAIASISTAALGTAFLILSAAHFRIDQIYGRPFVTWEGPAVEWLSVLVGMGWSFSGSGFALGAYSLHRFRSRHDILAFLGMGVAVVNALGSMVFFGILKDGP